MKKVLYIIALVLFPFEGWSQTVSIKKSDGQTINYDINDIDYIELTNDGNNNNASIVGLWECTYFEIDTDYPGMSDNTGMQIGDRVWFESDGRYSTDYKSGDNETGRWSLKGNILTLRANVEPSFPFDYRITKLTSTELEFTLDIGIMKLLYRCKRVS